MYESDCPLTYTDYYADITHISSAKKQMLEIYFGDDEKLISGIFGLNRFRAINKNAQYCEGFAGFFVQDFLKLPLI